MRRQFRNLGDDPGLHDWSSFAPFGQNQPGKTTAIGAAPLTIAQGVKIEPDRVMLVTSAAATRLVTWRRRGNAPASRGRRSNHSRGGNASEIGSDARGDGDPPRTAELACVKLGRSEVADSSFRYSHEALVPPQAGCRDGFSPHHLSRCNGAAGRNGGQACLGTKRLIIALRRRKDTTATQDRGIALWRRMHRPETASAKAWFENAARSATR
jgi:hypothetical protein